jgi:hypothetical protein
LAHLRELRKPALRVDNPVDYPIGCGHAVGGYVKPDLVQVRFGRGRPQQT